MTVSLPTPKPEAEVTPKNCGEVFDDGTGALLPGPPQHRY